MLCVLGCSLLLQNEHRINGKLGSIIDVANQRGQNFTGESHGVGQVTVCQAATFPYFGGNRFISVLKQDPRIEILTTGTP